MPKHLSSTADVRKPLYSLIEHSNLHTRVPDARWVFHCESFMNLSQVVRDKRMQGEREEHRNARGRWPASKETGRACLDGIINELHSVPVRGRLLVRYMRVVDKRNGQFSEGNALS